MSTSKQHIQRLTGILTSAGLYVTLRDPLNRLAALGMQQGAERIHRYRFVKPIQHLQAQCQAIKVVAACRPVLCQEGKHRQRLSVLALCQMGVSQGINRLELLRRKSF